MERVVHHIPIAMRVLALCLWLGGLLVLGAVVAPSIFGTVRAAELPGGLPAENRLAGEIFGQCLRRVNVIGMICAVILLLAEIPSLRTRSGLSIFRLMMIVAAFGITLHLQYDLFPRIEALQWNSGTPEFDALHRQYTQEARFVSLALLPVAVTAGYEALPAKRRRKSG